MNFFKSFRNPQFIGIALLLFAALQLNVYTAHAQSTNSSPYSIYGIGDIVTKGFSQGFALGGTNIAMQNDTSAMFFINSGNPASYSNIRLTTAELGVNAYRLQLKIGRAHV